MKKTLINCVIAFVIMSSLSSCATVFGGKVTTAVSYTHLDVYKRQALFCHKYYFRLYNSAEILKNAFGYDL